MFIYFWLFLLYSLNALAFVNQLQLLSVLSFYIWVAAPFLDETKVQNIPNFQIHAHTNFHKFLIQHEIYDLLNCRFRGKVATTQVFFTPRQINVSTFGNISVSFSMALLYRNHKQKIFD